MIKKTMDCVREQHWDDCFNRVFMTELPPTESVKIAQYPHALCLVFNGDLDFEAGLKAIPNAIKIARGETASCMGTSLSAAFNPYAYNVIGLKSPATCHHMGLGLVILGGSDLVLSVAAKALNENRIPHTIIDHTNLPAMASR